MGRVLRLALLGVWLLPAALPAQERPRPASPSSGSATRRHDAPARRDAAGPPPAASQLPGSGWVREPDLFRARPSTYAPRYDRTFPWGPWGPVVPAYGYPVVYSEPGETAGHRALAEEAARVPASVEPSAQPRDPDRSVEPPAAQEPPAPAPVAPPRTFYVIPRCYAGDAPPRPEQLPRGCDVADLRVVPPRAFTR